jgi:hypothetical protein
MKIIINENQLMSVINEAIPYSIAKKYLEINRNPIIKKYIDDMFNKLKELPRAILLDKNGDRVAFPYKQIDLENEISKMLKSNKYKLIDFNNNEALSIKNTIGEKPQPIKISKALTIISKKSIEAERLLKLYNYTRSQSIKDEDSEFMIVFSRKKYDLAGMTYGRSWPSNCMHLTDGVNKEFILKDIESGTIICYLITKDDINIENPIGRILIKPFVNVDDESEVILYPETKTYGDIKDTFKFVKDIDKYMEAVQNIKSKYDLKQGLYCDGRRKSILGKDALRIEILKGLEQDYLPKDENELALLTSDDLYRYINKKIDKYKNAPSKYKELKYDEFKVATPEQINQYIDFVNQNNLTLDMENIRFLRKTIIKDYIDNQILKYKNKLRNKFNAAEITLSTDNQKKEYSNIVINHNEMLDDKLFDLLSFDEKVNYFSTGKYFSGHQHLWGSDNIK